MSEKERIIHSGIIEQYVLGLLDARESTDLERLFSKYPELIKHKESLEQAMEQILLDNSIAPPPNLRNQILENIDKTPTPQNNGTLVLSSSPQRRWSMYLITAVAIFSTILAFLSYQGRRASEVKYVQLQSKYESLEMDCEKTQVLNDELIAQGNFLKNSQKVVLNGSKKAPEALAIVYWNEHEQSAFIDVLNMPVTPSDKEYQLWADVDGEMINIGTFDEQGIELQSIAFIEHATSLNITLEPKGNNKVATVSQLYLNGEV